MHLPVDFSSSSNADLLSIWALVMAGITVITLFALLVVGLGAPSSALPLESLKASEKDNYEKIQHSLADIHDKIKQLKK